MPWTGRSAKGFTKKAKSPTAKRQWAKLANSALKHGESDATAIKMANAAVAKRKKRK